MLLLPFCFLLYMTIEEKLDHLRGNFYNNSNNLLLTLWLMTGYILKILICVNIRK